jgi:ATP-dependent DNA helicase RecG
VTYTTSEIDALLNNREDEHLECKRAENTYDFKKLVRYCAALANEGGGTLVLGVTDRPPRQIVGTRAFENPHKIKAQVIEILRLRITVDEILHPDGRVLVISVPSRPFGVPVQYEGSYWMRRDEDVVPMTWDMVVKIRDEIRLDFSSDIHPTATLDDLDPLAITELRARWHRKSRNDRLLEISDEQLLLDAELVLDGGITNAALILLGTQNAVGRMFPQAETIFEYRSSEASGAAQQRTEFRKGFLLYQDELWTLINARNDLQHFQNGLFKIPIQTFNEAIVREAILNAISHRDYNDPASVFVRQTPRTMEFSSPGGFPTGITLENILWRQSPRNRRLAEVLAKCGLVERSGQGVNLIFEESIKESKPLPDYSRSDAHAVDLVIRGDIDPKFLRFLEKVGRERLADFHTGDLLLIDLIHREQPIPEEYKSRLPYLIEQGVIERVRGKEYVLSGQFHKYLGRRGTYTRKLGLDRDENRAILLKHIEMNKEEGSPLRDLGEVLPSKSRMQVRTLLRGMMLDGMIHYVGYGAISRWHPGPKPTIENDFDDDSDDE